MPPIYELRILGPTALVGPDEARAAAFVRQPKRLAILAYSSLSTADGYCRRDHLVGLFWPELDQVTGRTYLRKALYGMRETLGDELLLTRGDEELRVDPEKVWCDAVALQQHLRNNEWDEALSLNRGDLLDGLYPEGVSQEFQEGLSGTRKRFRDGSAHAAWKCSAREEARGDRAAAVALARRARELDPDSEAGVQRLLLLLDRLGDRGSALREYAHWQARLKAEFDVEPAPETRWIANRLQDARRGESHETPPAATWHSQPDALPVTAENAGASAMTDTWRSRTPGGSAHGARYLRWLPIALAIPLIAAAYLVGRNGTDLVGSRSIAVAPIREIGEAVPRAFVAALHEELLTQLTLDTSLVIRVQGPTATAFILTTAVQHRENRIRVTLRLVRASDDLAIWAGIFDDTVAAGAASAEAIATRVATVVSRRLDRATP